METAFRKIDIDIYDEDVLQDEELYEPDPRDPAQVVSDTKAKASQVRGILAKYVRSLAQTQLTPLTSIVIRGDIAAALDFILKDAPYGPNVDEAKVRVYISLRYCSGH